MLCNINFFDKDLNLIHHDFTDMPSIDDDYLAPESTTVTIGKTHLIDKGQLVYIFSDVDFFGIVTEVDNLSKTTDVTIKSFISIFEQDVLFDTRWLSNGTSLENVIGTLIRNNWVNSGDTHQNYGVFNVLVGSSSVTSFKLDIEPDIENQNYSIVSLHKDVISPALSKYGISIRIKPYFDTRKINFWISTNTQTKYIDADLDNVEVLDFVYKKPSELVNKIDIWNTTNFTEKITYYLHSDGTYSTSNTKRVEPVVFGIHLGTPDDNTTFANAAKKIADDVFGQIEYENLIELSVASNDILVDPKNIAFGDIGLIIYNGTVYKSILTGKKYSDYVTLVYGVMRTDYTKKLRLGGR